MKKVSGFAGFALFFLFFAAIAYTAFGAELNAFFGRLFFSNQAVSSEQAAIAAGVLTGDLLLSYIFYYVFFKALKTFFPALIYNALIFTAVILAALCAVRELPQSAFSRGAALYGMCALALIALLRIGILVYGIRKIIRTVDAVAFGREARPSGIKSGGEIQALSVAVDALAENDRKGGSRYKARESALLRFLPDSFCALMGVASIDEASRETSFTRTMTLAVFSYSGGIEAGEEIGPFNGVNSILACFDRIITKSGGSVFSYTFNECVAVFEDCSSAVSAAVLLCQSRAYREKRFLVNIGIDRGEVTFGLIGGESLIAPEMLSPALDSARALAALGAEMAASILCSFDVASLSKEFRQRYVGKSGAQSGFRVYEIFEGDVIRVCEGKEQSAGEFTDALYRLCVGDLAGARRDFISIARRWPEDGAARYLLGMTEPGERKGGAYK